VHVSHSSSETFGSLVSVFFLSGNQSPALSQMSEMFKYWTSLKVLRRPPRDNIDTKRKWVAGGCGELCFWDVGASSLCVASQMQIHNTHCLSVLLLLSWAGGRLLAQPVLAFYLVLFHPLPRTHSHAFPASRCQNKPTDSLKKSLKKKINTSNKNHYF